ncbi:alpha-amylase family glycosyl hydrolase [Orenia marismortui]|uniref:alpha-amylase family glycosyl hydrolase n=1 Tax=Orenia marismortui TaxID=46469 RepID=UPI00035C1346|nr:alpha-amylase family glycosyl hydrolase [Orenia marismortui]
MFYKLRGKKLALLLSIITLFMLVGCSSNGGSDELTGNQSKLGVTVKLPGSQEDGASIQKLDINLKKIEGKVINVNDSNDIHESEAKIEEGTTEVGLEFKNLKKNAKYKIIIKGIYVDGDEEIVAYKSPEDTTAVTNDDESTVTVTLELQATKNLTMNFENMPAEAASGIVTIVPEEVGLEAEIDVAEAKADFGSTPAGEYAAKVKLYDSEENLIVDKATEVFEALPGRAENVSVDLENTTSGGKLKVNVTWQLAPKAPTGLTAKYNESTGAIDLTWDDSADKYLVYRGTSEAEKLPLMEKAITTHNYSDTDVQGDTTYYYWVRAYDADALASDLSDSVSETTPAPEGITLHFKSDSSATPYVYSWYTGTDGTKYEPTGGWNNQTAMDSESNGWYKLTISKDNLNNYESGISFGIIITDSANGGNKLTGGDTEIKDLGQYWWDGSDWTTDNLNGPSEPKIPVSPKGGTYKGDTVIEVGPIDDGGASITSSSCEFAGETFTLSTTEITEIKISDYVADGEKGTLTASATNSEGTTEVSYDYTRDDGAVVDKFTWDNASVYFVMTDRFFNGDPSNDNSYGRITDYGSDKLNTGTFHGGDIAGLTEKLEEGYFEDLGVNAIWITAPYEQMHGFCGGGSGGFPHYGYHGYYALDWTMMDKNMGTIEEFRDFVNTAHSQGIRVVMDVVMNHPGYNTMLDGVQYGFGGIDASEEEVMSWRPSSGENWHSYHDHYIDYDNKSAWSNWWNGWVRAGLPGYEPLGEPPLKQLPDSGLPDIKTEITNSIGLAPILETKWSMEQSGYDQWIVPAAEELRKNLNNSAPADYIIKWLAAWVEEFGIDGFRVDTAKHVEKWRWGQLKGAAEDALDTWRAENSNAPGAEWDEDFWMTAEDFGHGVGRSDYFNDNDGDGTQDFESVINFSFNQNPPSISNVGDVWQDYANRINNGDWNVLTYINSHDARDTYNWYDTNKDMGTMLLLLPGGVQIYYGDENSRELGPEVDGDANQPTRSDYQWNTNQDILAHWQKVGQFRHDHPAVGAGQQTDLGNNTYGRTYSGNAMEDKVVIAIGGSGTTSVNVEGIFADGTQVRDAYDGDTATVSNSTVEFDFDNGVILIEAVN